MYNVWIASKTIILFLIIVIGIQLGFGDKIAQRMMYFILFSMLILQSDLFSKYVNSIVSNLTNSSKTTTHISSSGKEHGGSIGGF